MMRGFLTAVLACVVAASLGGCGGSTGTRPATAAVSVRSAPAGSTSASGRAPLRLAVLGDSYSNGQSVGAQSAWPVVMAALLTREGLPVQVVANPSITGYTTDQMLSVGLGPIRASHPDVMTVMLGVNDQVQGHSPAQFTADYRTALSDAITITGSPRRVIAVDIPDYAVTPAGAEYGSPAQITVQLEAFNAIIRSVAAADHVAVVSVFGISRRDAAGALADDGLHPSARQLRQWAEHIAPVALSEWRGLSTSG